MGLEIGFRSRFATVANVYNPPPKHNSVIFAVLHQNDEHMKDLFPTLVVWYCVQARILI